MARRSRQRFVRPPARTKIWIGQGVGQTTISASAKTLVSTLSAGALLLRPFTILRTHMLVSYKSDQTAASEQAFGTLGLLIVTDTAASIGATAVPNPSGVDGDPEADWYLWQAMVADFELVTAAGFESDAGHQYQIDSKAMRKVGPDDDDIMVFDQQNAVGSELVTNGRQLIQLH